MIDTNEDNKHQLASAFDVWIHVYFLMFSSHVVSSVATVKFATFLVQSVVLKTSNIKA